MIIRDPESIKKFIAAAEAGLPVDVMGQSFLITSYKMAQGSPEVIFGIDSRACYYSRSPELVIDLVEVVNQQREEEPMNRSTTVFLVDNTVKAFTAIYEDGHKAEYFKTFIADVKKDDLMVVESGTRHGFTVVKVIDPTAVVDIKDTNVIVKWAVSRLDLTEHREIVKQEADAVEKVKAAEFNKMRKDLIDNMVGPDAEALKAINIRPAGGARAAR